MEKQLLLLSSLEDTAVHVRKALEPLKYRVTVKERLSSGLKAMHGRDLVLLDIADGTNGPKGHDDSPDTSSGIKALREIKAYCPDATVLVSASTEFANEALEEGAYQFIKKPIDQQELKAAVRSASLSIHKRERLDQLRGFGPPKFILGMGSTMRKAFKQIEAAAAQDALVVIVGERGTGKMLVADAIHKMSSRRRGPCLTIETPERPITEELFGAPGIQGKAALADGGTLFIKDMHRFSPEAVEEIKTFVCSGMRCPDGKQPSLRLIISSESPLEWTKAPPKNQSESQIHLPPLRERTEDIEPLAEHFALEASALFATGKKTFSQNAIKALLSHKWPGNIGELKSTVRRACMLAKGETIEPCHITLDDGSTYCSIQDFLGAKISRYLGEFIKMERSGLHESVMGEVEKTLIRMVLDATEGNQVKAAHTLGITRTTLRAKMKTYAQDGKKGKKPSTRKRRASLTLF